MPAERTAMRQPGGRSSEVEVCRCTEPHAIQSSSLLQAGRSIAFGEKPPASGHLQRRCATSSLPTVTNDLAHHSDLKPPPFRSEAARGGWLPGRCFLPLGRGMVNCQCYRLYERQ